MRHGEAKVASEAEVEGARDACGNGGRMGNSSDGRVGQGRAVGAGAKARETAARTECTNLRHDAWRNEVPWSRRARIRRGSVGG